MMTMAPGLVKIPLHICDAMSVETNAVKPCRP